MSSLPTRGPTPLTQAELRSLLLQYRHENWEGIQTPSWRKRVVDDILNDEGESVLRQIAPFWKLPAEARVLDVGSGVGSFVLACRRRGIRAFGIEPDRIGQGGRVTAIQIARRRLEDPVFVSGVGEKLPFADASFGLVTMNQVLEHVSDQASVVREAVRVVKPGGAVYVACPNYLRFYEPHYKLPWFPLLPKPLARWYLRLRGRSPVMLNQLTYTTNARLRALTRCLGSEYLVLDLHGEQVLAKLKAGSFASRRARLLAKFTRLALVGRLCKSALLLLARISEGGCEMLILRRPFSQDYTC